MGGVLHVAAWSAGCTSTPPATAPAGATTEVFASRTWTDERLQANLAALGAVQGSAATSGLTADDVLAAALTFNPQLAIESARLATARAVVQQAHEHPNPMLSFAPERVISAAMGVSPWVLAASLVWPLRTAGKRDLAIEQALATGGFDVARHRIRRLGSSCQVARVAVRRRDRPGTRAQRARRTGVARRPGDAPRQAGASRNHQPIRSRALAPRAAHGVEPVQPGASDLSVARHELAATAGMPIEQIQGQPLGHSCLDIGASNPTPDVAVMSDEAIGARLEVRAKLAEFRAADAAWRLELARRTPDLALGPGYTYDRGDHKITFSASGELPLSNRNDGSIAKAAAERDRVAAELEALQIEVLQAVSRAIDGLRDAEAAQASVAQLVAESDELVHREVQRQASGEADEPTVIAARLIA
jgi:CRISPR system Cascade subunit CasA